MDMMKNKKTLKVAVVAAVCSFIGLLIAGSNVSAQDFDSYFNGNKNATSISEFVGNIQISKANIPDIKLEIKKPEIDVVDEGGLGGNVVDSIVDTFSDSDEFVQFWDDLREDVYDDICKAVRINLSEGAEFADIVGIKGKFKRYLKQYPDKRIALIDEVHVRLTGDYSSDIFNVNDTPFNVSFNSKAEGKSIVVRRLDGVKYCDEILTMVDLRKVKTILPIRSRRILKMKPGEIWKFPLTFQIGLGGSVGHSFSGISVSLSLKSSKERKPSVTLYKMNEETLRIRVRLNRATFKSVGIAAKAFTISAGDIGLFETSNKLTEFIHDELADEIAGQFNKYLSFKLGLSHNRTKGKKILMEFLLDAKDPEQIDRLVDFLKGDLGVVKEFIKMGFRFDHVDAENDFQGGLDALNAVENIGEEILETEADFVGSDHYNSNGNSFDVQLPLVYSRKANSSLRYDRYQTADEKEIIHSHQASQNVSDSFVNVPWAGKLFKQKVKQSVYVVNYETENRKVTEPVMQYQRYDGAVRYSELNARKMIKEVNDILQYAGVNGEGTNSDYIIDTDSLFPNLVEAENNPEYDEEGFVIQPGKRQYGSAILSFSMIFTRTAVRSIINAPAERIMKAFFNVMDVFDKKVISKVVHLFNINSDGKVKYNYRKARKILEKEFWWVDFNDNENEGTPMDVVKHACYKVSRIVADLASVRNTADWKEQSGRLADIMGGKGKSRMGYNRMLKLVVQLVDPEFLYAKINYKTHKKIDGEKDITIKREFFNPKVNAYYGNKMAKAEKIRNKFNEPSTLTD